MQKRKAERCQPQKKEKTMPHKQDFFSLLLIFGRIAARYDWVNHCAGADHLMQGENAPLCRAGGPCLHVRSPHNASHGLDVYADGDTYETYDEYDIASSIRLAWSDVAAWELHGLNFSAWVQRLLGMAGNIKPRLDPESHVIMWKVGKEEVFLYMGNSLRELRGILHGMTDQRSATILFLSDWWRKSPPAYHEIGRFPLLSAFSMQELVRCEKEKYVYCHEVKFTELIKQHDDEHPPAKLLARPAGAQWHDLCIQIQTDSHHEILELARDVFLAWYEDGNGKRMGNIARRSMGDLKALCRNNKATLIGMMLKQYAANGGREYAVQDPKKRNQLDGVRKKLREFLCEQFGYSLDDFPIRQEMRGVYRTEFSISFSDGKSDPLLPSRQRSHRSMS